MMNRAPAIRKLLVAATLLVLSGSIFAIPATAVATGLVKVKLVCWTDDAGRRACGDVVPPKYAKTERQVLDDAGRVRKVLPAQLTEEQRAAATAETEEKARAALANEQQAAYDRSLLQTYANPGELVALRNDRLASIDSRAQLTQTAAGRDAESLEALKRRLPAEGSSDKAPARLLASVAEFEQLVRDHDRAIARLNETRSEICSTFERDIRRFQELTVGRVDAVSTCPAPGSLATDKAAAAK